MLYLKKYFSAKIFTIVFSFIMFLQCSIIRAQYTYIPDSWFEHYLVIQGYDDVVDGQVLTANIENVTSLPIGEHFISDMTGIQDFAALEYLDVSDNYLSAIDLSQNVNLKTFIADRNYLETLDFTSNPNLEHIEVQVQNHSGEFFLTAVDVSQCYNLEYLDVEQNKWISEIDVSNSPNLEYLDVSGNQITFLDVTNNPNLVYLDVAGLMATSLNISQNTLLEYLDIDLSDLTSIDLSQNINLEELRAFEVCGLTELNISQNTNLKFIGFGYDGDPYDPDIGVTELDLTNNINLENILIFESNIQSINLNNCPNLYEFDLYYMFNLQHFSVKNGHNEDIMFATLEDYDWTPDPLFCIEVDHPELANAYQYPYDDWNFFSPYSQYTASSDCSIGVTESELYKDVFTIYPNPANDHFSIDNPDDLSIEKVEVYNQVGALLITTQQTQHIDIQKLPTGIYYIQTHTMEHGIQTLQLVKE